MAVMNDSVESAGLGSVTPEQISNYELYTLPAITSIKDKQTKQIGLIEKSGVKYAKEFNFNSPLYFGGRLSLLAPPIDLPDFRKL